MDPKPNNRRSRGATNPTVTEDEAATEQMNEDGSPVLTKMPRAAHEIRTGTGPDDFIAAGTIITPEVAERHGLRDEGDRLLKQGAIELIDVLRG